MSIGETLAAARREAGLDVTQVSEATCIRARIIDDIENDDFALCGGHFYARGHIRSIARTLGIDPEPLVAQYDEEHGGSPAAAQAAPASVSSQPPVSAPKRRRPNWTVALGVALLVVVVVYGVFRLAGDDASRGQHPGNSPAANTGRPQQGDQQGDAGTAAETGKGAEKGRGHSAGAPGVESSEVKVSMHAAAPAWVSASSSDGETLFRRTMHAGDDAHWTDKKMVEVKIGNAGGVSLVVNGRDFGRVGADGHVVTLNIYADHITGLPVG